MNNLITRKQLLSVALTFSFFFTCGRSGGKLLLCGKMVVPPKLSIFSKIGFHHEKPEVFVTTQWTRDARKSVWFLLFQWLLAAFYIGTISYGFYGFYDYLGYWLIYLTNWGVVLCTVATTSAAVLTTLYHFDCIELTPQSSSYKVVWLLSNVSTVLAFQITIIYWALLHNGNYQLKV